MTTESNVRKVIVPDLAFDRWWAERGVVDYDGRREMAEGIFRAGYEAAIRDLAQERPVHVEDDNRTDDEGLLGFGPPSA